MSIADTLLPEFDQEMATTRKVLERVPTDKGQWKPHPEVLLAWPPVTARSGNAGLAHQHRD